MSRPTKTELLEYLLQVEKTAGQCFDELEHADDGIMPLDGLRKMALLEGLVSRIRSELVSQYYLSGNIGRDVISEMQTSLRENSRN